MTQCTEILEMIEERFGGKTALPGQGYLLTRADWEGIAKKFSDAGVAILTNFFSNSRGAWQRFERNLKHPQGDEEKETPYDRRCGFLTGVDVICPDIRGWRLPVSIPMVCLAEKEYDLLAESLFGESILADAKHRTQLAIDRGAEIERQIVKTEQAMKDFETDFWASGTQAALKLKAELAKHHDDDLDRMKAGFTYTVESLCCAEAELDSLRDLLVKSGIETLERLETFNRLFSPMGATEGRSMERAMKEVKEGRFRLKKYLLNPSEVGREIRKQKADDLAHQAKEAQGIVERAKARAAQLGKMAEAAIKAITK